MRWMWLGVSLCSLCLIACDFEAKSSVDPADTLDEIEVGRSLLQLEVVFTEPDRRRGLMYREQLPSNQGMLFVFEHPHRLSFWMRDTSIPLEIGFFDKNGVLREIHALVPFDETPVRSRREDLVMAVELNRGDWAGNGIVLGDRIDLEAVREALIRRGGVPERWFPAR